MPKPKDRDSAAMEKYLAFKIKKAADVADVQVETGKTVSCDDYVRTAFTVKFDKHFDPTPKMLTSLLEGSFPRIFGYVGDDITNPRCTFQLQKGDVDTLYVYIKDIPSEMVRLARENDRMDFSLSQRSVGAPSRKY